MTEPLSDSKTFSNFAHISASLFFYRRKLFLKNKQQMKVKVEQQMIGYVLLAP